MPWSLTQLILIAKNSQKSRSGLARKFSQTPISLCKLPSRVSLQRSYAESDRQFANGLIASRHDVEPDHAVQDAKTLAFSVHGIDENYAVEPLHFPATDEKKAGIRQ